MSRGPRRAGADEQRTGLRGEQGHSQHPGGDGPVRRPPPGAGGWGGVGDPNDKPGLFGRAIKVAIELASRYVYEDMVRVSNAIRAYGLE